MANGDDAFKSLLGRFGYGKHGGDKSAAAMPADDDEEVLPLAVDPDLLPDHPEPVFRDGGFGLPLQAVAEPAEAGALAREYDAPDAVAEPRDFFAQPSVEEILAPLPPSPPLARRGEGLSEERLALLQRLAQEARGESAQGGEDFDMGYHAPLVESVRQPAVEVHEREVDDALPVPVWARVAAEQGMLGHSAEQVLASLDALGLVNDDRYVAQAAAHWPVAAAAMAFDELARVPVAARADLPPATRERDELGRGGYFYLKGDSVGARALIVVDGSDPRAVDDVVACHRELESRGQACRVALLPAYAYRWALRRFLWAEIIADGDVERALDVAGASRAHAAPLPDGKRLLLLETAFGMEAVAPLPSDAAAQWLARPDATDDAGIWSAALSLGGQALDKPAGLPAFGLDDHVAINRLVKELSRPGGIVFVAGEMAEPLAAALAAEAWSQGLALGGGDAGLPRRLLEPDARQLQASLAPVLAVYPGRNASAQSALLAMLGDRPDWAKGRVTMGVNTMRVPGLCPLCAVPVDADQAARELTEVVSDFRNVDFGHIRTRNVRQPCCGSGYAGEVWLSEVWDGKLCQRDFGAAMPADLVDKGLRPDQRISSRLLLEIQAGRVDYRSAEGV
ncbi:hypothetical protein ACPRNU_16625 [Chromobacterium vaccinii]|uniref:hypothetical protein n=1 Tax=Chromobacterium vaccinii TaxID=1108595 RepID=UPI003C74C536